MIDDHCHEDMGSDPCGKPPVGYRLDVTEDDSPYPVCRQHLRPPYWLTARFERAQLRAARLALTACRDVRAARDPEAAMEAKHPRPAMREAEPEEAS